MERVAVCMYDIGPRVGYGHQRRIAAIAAELAKSDFDVRVEATHLHPVGDLIVVDSYRVRADALAAPTNASVVAIDDLARDLAVDVVIDPAPGATESEHPASRRVLAGPDYAPLMTSGPRLEPRDIGSVGVVLITAGGSVSGTVGIGMALELRRRLKAEVDIRLVLGGSISDPEIPDIEVVRSDEGLTSVIAASDLVITAAGVTMLESCWLGRPTVAYPLADNQRRQAYGAGRTGAVVAVEYPQVVQAAVELSEDIERRRLLSSRAKRLVDGLGARRIGKVLSAL